MVKITGAKEHEARLAAMTGPETVRQIGAALYAAADLVAVEEARLITEGSVSGKGHVASAPGEPPNADTHQLDRSIEAVLVEPLRAEVQTTAPYAIPLQFGTSKVAARPYADVALRNKKAAAIDLVVAAVRKIARGGKVVP
jgi:hypothetical protein